MFVKDRRSSSRLRPLSYVLAGLGGGAVLGAALAMVSETDPKLWLLKTAAFALTGVSLGGAFSAIKAGRTVADNKDHRDS